MAGNVLEFTDANFETEVLKSELPVLVDFWAEWCGPCLRLGPTIEELAADFHGQVRIGKMNTDQNSEIPTNYGISALPTMLVFKGGEIVDKLVGVNPKVKIASSLSKQLG
jgi:thioredoxin 1